MENKVNVYFFGKKYSVPAELTIMTAMEYAGYTLKRGCGCRHGFCGACATIYRIKGQNELKTCLACQTKVEEGIIFLNTTSLGIYAVAGVSKVTGILGNLIFVPLYACKCLKIKWNTFYPIIFRYIGTTFIMMIVFFGIKRLYVLPINWITFFVVCVIAGFAGCIVNFFVLLNHTERSIMKNKIMARVRK